MCIGIFYTIFSVPLIDVHILLPNEKDRFYVMFATRMSDKPMTVPNEIKGRKELEYAEFFMFLQLMSMPTNKEEIEYKLEHGMSALNEALSTLNLHIVVDMFRENYCA